MAADVRRVVASDARLLLRSQHARPRLAGDTGEIPPADRSRH